MAKKTNKAKQSKQVARIHSLHIESRVDQIYAEIMAGKYEAAIETRKILLAALPKASTYRVGVIINMGLVYLQMSQFKLAYQQGKEIEADILHMCTSLCYSCYIQCVCLP